MKTPIQIIERVDEIFCPAFNLSLVQVEEALLAMSEEVGDDLWLSC